MKTIELNYSVVEVAPASTTCELVFKSPEYTVLSSHVFPQYFLGFYFPNNLLSRQNYYDQLTAVNLSHNMWKPWQKTSITIPFLSHREMVFHISNPYGQVHIILIPGTFAQTIQATSQLPSSLLLIVSPPFFF